jgi:energy-coupling factor transport system permease protein
MKVSDQAAGEPDGAGGGVLDPCGTGESSAAGAGESTRAASEGSAIPASTTAGSTGSGSATSGSTTADPAGTAARPGRRPARGRGRRGDDDGGRRRRSFVLLRRVEADTPVHRLWAGTKLIGAAGVSLTVSLMPTWSAIAVMVALLVGSSLLARVPWGAVPRPPIWFWAVLLLGATLTVFSGGRPQIDVGGAHIGLGDLDSFARFTLVGVILLGAGAIIGWTTSLGDIGPAVGRLLRPLQLLRVPAEEWATAIALCIRSLPLLVEEIRVLIAARRLRPTPPARQGLVHWIDEAGDLLVAVLSVSLRRAAEMAEAMTARGGTASITARARGPQARDAVALVVLAGACSAGWLLPS